MELGFTTAVYVVAAVLFILSLGGLSGQESAKRYLVSLQHGPRPRLPLWVFRFSRLTLL